MNLAFYVRTQGEPDTIGPTLRAQTRAIDPSVNLFDVAPLREFIGASLYPQKVAASLMTIMGTIALVLAAVGALQRHGLLGGATHARDWRTHGARCTTSPCAAYGATAGACAYSNRSRRGYCTIACRNEDDCRRFIHELRDGYKRIVA